MHLIAVGQHSIQVVDMEKADKVIKDTKEGRTEGRKEIDSDDDGLLILEKYELSLKCTGQIGLTELSGPIPQKIIFSMQNQL